MPVPTLISELSTTPGSNSPSGADSPSVLDDHQRTAYAFIRTLSDTKAATTDAVLLAGAQTVTGAKTFSSPITGNVIGTASNVTGTVALANGGTGATTAAAAFTALKQAATDLATGVVELSNAAEAPDRTKTAVVLTPATLRDALAAQNDAPIYACRAWVNFNGLGVVAIRASGNVSSITDNGTGDYTVNFTTAMTDANYTAVFGNPGTQRNAFIFSTATKLAGSLRLGIENYAATALDVDQVNVAIFR